MSTTASVAKLNSDGSVRSIYVHFEGRVTHVGHTLLSHYQDPHKIDQLLSLGDLVFLRPQTGIVTHSPYTPKTARNPEWCVAFMRDRGDKFRASRTFSSCDEWIWNAGQAYNYLYSDPEWMVYEMGSKSNEFRSVTQVLLET